MSSQGLALYRRILRLHRTKLPFHLRQLGDSYVREEFRRHKKSEAKWLVAFFREWNGYAQQLETQRVMDGEIGANLGPEADRALSPEQREQLLKLRAEAGKPYAL
jgi:hypothetical protein